MDIAHFFLYVRSSVYLIIFSIRCNQFYLICVIELYSYDYFAHFSHSLSVYHPSFLPLNVHNITVTVYSSERERERDRLRGFFYFVIMY